jgi:hypothetical protein
VKRRRNSFGVRVGVLAEPRRPVPGLVGGPVRVDGDVGAGRHLADAGEEGEVVVVVEAESEVLVELLLVDPAGEGRVLEDGLDLRGEDHPVIVRGVEERLDAEVVAAEDELGGAAATVQEGDRPHAVEPLEGCRAPLRVRLQGDLGVAPGGEPPPLRLQLRAQLAVVVDLAVVDDVETVRRPSTSAGRRCRGR